MGKVKDEQQKIIDKCYKIYQNGGYSAVIDHIEDMKALGKPEYVDITDEHCDACDEKMPSLGGTCLICGQQTKSLYFKIVKQGWNKDLQREEIQIHCGENGNIFLIKTEQGFIVDVYGQDDNVNTMTVWEEDLLSDDENELSDITVHDSNRIWSEIHDDFEDEGFIHLDAWTTADDMEDGKVIAKINIQTKEIEYLDERAKTDEFAQEVIQERLKTL